MTQPYPVEKIVKYPVKVPVPGENISLNFVLMWKKNKLNSKAFSKKLIIFTIRRIVQLNLKILKYPLTILAPYPVEKKVHYPVKVPVHIPKPYPVEKVVKVPVTVHVDRPVPVHVDKPVPYEVVKKVPYEVIKNVPVPVHVHGINFSRFISFLQFYQI